MVLIENLIWITSLVAPLLAGALTVYLVRRRPAERTRVGFIGAVAVFALGAAGSYYAGETILGAVMGSGDIPMHLVAQAWHRMWYPLGVSLLVGVAITLYSLLPHTSAT